MNILFLNEYLFYAPFRIVIISNKFHRFFLFLFAICCFFFYFFMNIFGFKRETKQKESRFACLYKAIAHTVYIFFRLLCTFTFVQIFFSNVGIGF